MRHEEKKIIITSSWKHLSQKQIYINYRAIKNDSFLGWKFQDRCHGRRTNSGDKTDDKTWHVHFPWFIHCFTRWEERERKKKQTKDNKNLSCHVGTLCLRIWMEWRQFFGSHEKTQHKKSRSSFHSSFIQLWDVLTTTGLKKGWWGAKYTWDRLKQVLDI